MARREKGKSDERSPEIIKYFNKVGQWAWKKPRTFAGHIEYEAMNRYHPERKGVRREGKPGSDKRPPLMKHFNPIHVKDNKTRDRLGLLTFV
jgi:hypothetical protein